MGIDFLNSNLLTLILAASPITHAILIILLLLSVVSWAVIFYKWRSLRKATKENRRFMAFFRKLEDFGDLRVRAEHLPDSPLARIFLEVHTYLQHRLDSEEAGSISMRSVQGWLRTATEKQIVWCEEYLSFLATTGNVAPFIGLFGTVLGIMSSFQAIGQLGTASIAAVAPGVAEALLATAAGLFAAIPAVVAYNHYLNRIRILAGEMETFSGEFINRVEERVSKTRAAV